MFKIGELNDFLGDYYLILWKDLRDHAISCEN